MRVIPSGTFAGDVLIADSSQANLLNSSGIAIKSYALPGNSGNVFALTLDPKGTDFWAGDSAGSIIWEVDIANGHIDEQFNCSCTPSGLSVFSGVPEPASLALLVSSLLGFAMIRRQRKTP